jgi:hypothetical protein
MAGHHSLNSWFVQDSGSCRNDFLICLNRLVNIIGIHELLRLLQIKLCTLWHHDGRLLYSLSGGGGENTHLHVALDCCVVDKLGPGLVSDPKLQRLRFPAYRKFRFKRHRNLEDICYWRGRLNISLIFDASVRSNVTKDRFWGFFTLF